MADDRVLQGAVVIVTGTPAHPCRCAGTCGCSGVDAGRHWQDWSYLSGRSKPTGAVHCQEHHVEIVAFRREGADRPGYSIRLRPSDKRTCSICGK